MIVDVEIGFVSNNNDPDKKGRIKATLPMLGNEEYTEWIEPFFPPGFFNVPEVSEQVEVVLPSDQNVEREVGLVEFPEFVFWRAILIDDSDDSTLPSDFATNYPKRRGLYTKAGHILMFDDDSTTPLVEFRHASGHVIRMQGGTPNKVEMTHAGGQTVEMTNDGNATIDCAPGGQVFVRDGSGATEALARITSDFISHITGFFNTHLHTAPPMGGSTSVPTVPDLTPYTGTSVLKAK